MRDGLVAPVKAYAFSKTAAGAGFPASLSGNVADLLMTTYDVCMLYGIVCCSLLA